MPKVSRSPTLAALVSRYVVSVTALAVFDSCCEWGVHFRWQKNVIWRASLCTNGPSFNVLLDVDVEILRHRKEESRTYSNEEDSRT